MFFKNNLVSMVPKLVFRQCGRNIIRLHVLCSVITNFNGDKWQEKSGTLLLYNTKIFSEIKMKMYDSSLFEFYETI